MDTKEKSPTKKLAEFRNRSLPPPWLYELFDKKSESPKTTMSDISDGSGSEVGTSDPI